MATPREPYKKGKDVNTFDLELSCAWPNVADIAINFRLVLLSPLELLSGQYLNEWQLRKVARTERM
jgi:hypothetical protein